MLSIASRNRNDQINELKTLLSAVVAGGDLASRDMKNLNDFSNRVDLLVNLCTSLGFEVHTPSYTKKFVVKIPADWISTGDSKAFELFDFKKVQESEREEIFKIYDFEGAKNLMWFVIENLK